MAISQIPSDLTFRFAKTGAGVTSNYIETVLGICQRLFHAVPERDIYNKEGFGLDIMGRVHRASQSGINGRDSEYELKIRDQFQRFTDIQVVNVMVFFKNGIMTVLMDGNYGDFQFQMKTSSDPQLATEISPKTIPGL